MLFWYENGLKGEILHSFISFKGKMVISHLKKYGQILYQKIALRVWVPTQQTARDFEFPRPSYGHFTKIALAGRGEFDISNGTWTDPFLTLLGREALDMLKGTYRHVEGDLGRPLLYFVSHINQF